MSKTCLVEGCVRPVKVRGWCNTHYAYWRIHGIPVPPPRTPRACSVADCDTVVKALGLCQKHYYRQKRTGTTDAGYDLRRARTEKVCAMCREPKPFSEFYRNRTAWDGMGAYCKPCSSRRALDWYYANPEKVRARDAITGTEDGRRRRAKQLAATIAPFTRQQLDARLSMFSGCWMCGGPAGCVDHVKPLAKGGPHILANLRPACRACNGGKAARWPYPLAVARRVA